ncbi:MAG: hypothetical protein R3F30_06685 [Planctomycetota bacterium]
MLRAALAVSALLTTASLPAQTRVVLPSLFEDVESSEYTTYPFSLRSDKLEQRTCSYQEIHDLPASTTGKVSALEYRRDVGNPSGPSKAFQVEVEVTLATATVTSSGLGSSFAANLGKDAKVVVKRRKLDWPAQLTSSTGPLPFAFAIPFDSGQTFSLAPGSLCIDIRVFDNDLHVTSGSNQPYFDRAQNDVKGLGVRDGRGCFASGGRQNPAFCFGETQVDPTRSLAGLHVDLAYARSGSVAALYLAASVLPGAGVLLPGDCHWYLDPLTMFHAIPATDPLKDGQYSFPPDVGTQRQFMEFPWDDAFANGVLYAQPVCLDPRANSAGLVTANFVELHMPPYRSTGTGVSSAIAGGSPVHTTATSLFPGRGLVTRFVLQ